MTCTCALPHGDEHAAKPHGGVAHDAGSDLGAQSQRLVRQVQEVVRDEEHEEQDAGSGGSAVGCVASQWQVRVSNASVASAPRVG